GEWEETAEAKVGTRTFHESLRFPWPKAPVQVVLKKRGKDNLFREIWTTRVDPSSPAVNAADVAAAGKVWTVFENGPPTEKVDLLPFGGGSGARERLMFPSDVKRPPDRLSPPGSSRPRKGDFTVRAMVLPAATSGVNRPHVGKFRRTAVSAEYYIFESERY